jgi:hypothetical protein
MFAQYLNVLKGSNELWFFLHPAQLECKMSHETLCSIAVHTKSQLLTTWWGFEPIVYAFTMTTDQMSFWKIAQNVAQPNFYQN